MNALALLFALIGAGLFISARLNPGRMVDRGAWAHPPTWLRTLAGQPTGPMSTVNLMFQVYGIGMAILGLLAGLVRSDPVLVEFLLACWVIGGILLLTLA